MPDVSNVKQGLDTLNEDIKTVDEVLNQLNKEITTIDNLIQTSNWTKLNYKNIFVSSISGDDNNDGLSAEKPFKTIAGAIKKTNHIHAMQIILLDDQIVATNIEINNRIVMFIGGITESTTIRITINNGGVFRVVSGLLGAIRIIFDVRKSGSVIFLGGISGVQLGGYYRVEINNYSALSTEPFITANMSGGLSPSNTEMGTLMSANFSRITVTSTQPNWRIIGNGIIYAKMPIFITSWQNTLNNGVAIADNLFQIGTSQTYLAWS